MLQQALVSLLTLVFWLFSLKFFSSMILWPKFLQRLLLFSGILLLKNFGCSQKLLVKYTFKTMYLSVIIPAYNEAERIGKTLYAVSDYFRTALYKYEIIVVNDGSADATQEIVNELTVSIPYLTQISYTQNRGKGWAVKQGMLKAKGKYRLFMDADNSTAIKYVEELLREAETSDVVIGSRRISGARITLSQPLYREFLGYVFRALVHAIVPLDVSDSQNGFKLFTAEAAEII